jgi:hypothetical protein
MESGEVGMTTVAHLAFFAALGLSLGLAQFVSLRRSVRTYVLHGLSRGAVLSHVLRLALVAFAWVVLARLGGAAGLLAALVGFLPARPLVAATFGRGP